MQNSSTGIEVLVGVGVKPSRLEKWPSWKIHTIAPRVAPRVSALPSSARTGCTMLPVNRNSRMNVVTTMMQPASSRRELIACLASMRAAVSPPTSTCVPAGAGTSRICLTIVAAAPEVLSRPVVIVSRCVPDTVPASTTCCTPGTALSALS